MVRRGVRAVTEQNAVEVDVHIVDEIQSRVVTERSIEVGRSTSSGDVGIGRDVRGHGSHRLLTRD